MFININYYYTPVKKYKKYRKNKTTKESPKQQNFKMLKAWFD